MSGFGWLVEPLPWEMVGITIAWCVVWLFLISGVRVLLEKARGDGLLRRLHLSSWSAGKIHLGADLQHHRVHPHLPAIGEDLRREAEEAKAHL